MNQAKFERLKNVCDFALCLTAVDPVTAAILIRHLQTQQAAQQVLRGRLKPVGGTSAFQLAALRNASMLPGLLPNANAADCNMLQMSDVNPLSFAANAGAQSNNGLDQLNALRLLAAGNTQQQLTNALLGNLQLLNNASGSPLNGGNAQFLNNANSGLLNASQGRLANLSSLGNMLDAATLYGTNVSDSQTAQQASLSDALLNSLAANRATAASNGGLPSVYRSTTHQRFSPY